MFGKVLYFDRKAIDDYSAIASEGKKVRIEEVEVSKDIGGSIGNSSFPIEVDAKAEKKYVAKMIESMLYDCADFEKIISGRDDYFDFTVTNIYDINTVPKGSIIKAEARIEVPEEFDFIQLIDEFKPLVMSSIEIKDGDVTSKDALKKIFGNANATRIPLIAEVEDILLCGKIYRDNIVSEYEDFVEQDESVTILARISSDIIKKEKPFYDPLKDFVRINRMMRRGMKKTDPDNKIAPLHVENDYRKIDVIAIYS